MISFSSLSKRPGATIVGIFSLALSSVLLLCGAGPVPIQNFLPQGSMQGDLNAGGHSITNAATVSAGTLTATSTLNVPTNFFSTNNVVQTTGSYADPIWITGLGWSKISSTPSTLSGYGITDAYAKTAADARYLQIGNNFSDLANAATARANLRVANSYSTLSLSAAGNTNLSASGPVNAETVMVGAGSGTYAASISLLDSGAVTGDLYELNVSIPASGNPTLTIYDNSTGGTSLATVTSNGTAGTTTLSFFFNGTNWVAYKKGALLLYQNLADLSSASTARINLGLGTLATQNGTFSGTSSGTNTGDQTIVLTGDATGSGTGSLTVTVGKIGGQAVSLAGSLTTSGANALTFVTTGTTNLTLPTTGTLLTTTGSGSSLTGIPTSVSNSDGTLTISPTTGSVVAGLNLAHANSWTATQTFQAPIIQDSGGKQVIVTVATASAVNYIKSSGSSTANAIGPYFQAGGTDTNVPLSIYGQGSGKVFINQTSTSFDTSGNLVLNGNLTFLNTVGGIIGVGTNSNASANIVGEQLSSTVASTSAVSLTTAAGANVTSISLTAGDWDVEGNINFAAAAATVTATMGGLSTTSVTVPTDGTEVYSGLQTTTLTAIDSVTLPRKRISLASTTTVYLVGKCTFSAGAVSAFGSISARRVR